MTEHPTRPASATAQEPVRKFLELSLIRLDGGTQPRAEMNLETVRDYAEAVAEQAIFPPVVVFFDGIAHWLADGFHRCQGTREAGQETILAEIRNGTKRDAVLYGLSANARHGLRETRADKRRKIETMLRDEEWVQWSDRKIGRQCGVHHETVAAVRAELEASGEIRQMEARTVERNGTVFTQSARIEPPATDDGAPAGHGEIRHVNTSAEGIDCQPLLPLVPAIATLGVPQEMVVAQQEVDGLPVVATDRCRLAKPDDPPAAPAEPGEVERLRAEVAELREQLAELSSNLAETIADNKFMARVVEADDKIAAALAEAGRYREQVRLLEERNRGLMNEKNAAVREAKYWKKKAEAAEKGEVMA